MNWKETFRYMLRLRLQKEGRQALVSLKQKPPHWAYPYLSETKLSALYKSYIAPMGQITKEFTNKHARSWDSELKQDAFGSDLNKLTDILQAYQRGLFEKEPAQRNTIAAILNIGESANVRNQAEWQKQIQFALGDRFMTDETWSQAMMQDWAANNFKLIKSIGQTYIQQFNDRVKQGYSNGKLWTDIRRDIEAMHNNLSVNRTKLLARDQIGKLNGALTQQRMANAGLNTYRWLTSMDERVRSSHQPLANKLCRWDNANLWSLNAGKDWEDRGSIATHVHPGVDIQCRCTAVADLSEILGEVKEQQGIPIVPPASAPQEDAPVSRDLTTEESWKQAKEAQEPQHYAAYTAFKKIRDSELTALESGTPARLKRTMGLLAYQSQEGVTVMQAALRGYEPTRAYNQYKELVPQLVDGVDKAFEEYPKGEGAVQAYRGFTRANPLELGKTYFDPGYLSYTTSEARTEFFSRPKTDRPIAYVIRSVLPQAKVLPILNYTDHDDSIRRLISNAGDTYNEKEFDLAKARADFPKPHAERELLSPRGGGFKVVGIHPHPRKDTFYLDVEYMDPKQIEAATDAIKLDNAFKDTLVDLDSPEEVAKFLAIATMLKWTPKKFNNE